MEERRERWWSKHKSAEEARGCGGEWRGRRAIRLARKARGGGVGEEWRELISIDHRRQLHYQHLLDTRWIHKLLPLACSRLTVHVRACVRTWWITFKVDLARGCQSDGFNPVRFDFHPSRIHVKKPQLRPWFPIYWHTEPYCNQTSLIPLLWNSFVLTRNYCTWMRLLSASQQRVLRAHSWINEPGCWDVSGREAAKSSERSSRTDRSLLENEEGRNKETK